MHLSKLCAEIGHCQVQLVLHSSSELVIKREADTANSSHAAWLYYNAHLNVRHPAIKKYSRAE
jgi:hypothetical protein